MFNKNLKLIGMLVGLAILIAAGFTISYSSNKSTVPFGIGSGGSGSAEKSFTFPQSLQGLNLSQSNSGPQAIGMISKLHGSNIKIKEGYIGQYDGASGQVMVWVSESSNTSEARQLFDIMDQKISATDGANSAEGGPPFTNRRTMRRGEISVIAVKGMGMENYYYQVGSKVYWLAVGGVDPVKTLDEFIQLTQNP